METTAWHALGQDALDRVARADWNRGLDHYDGEILDRLGNRPGGLVHVAQVGRSNFGQRRRADGDENRLRSPRGLFQFGGEEKTACTSIGLNQLAEARLINRDAARAQARDLVFIIVDANDLMPEVGQAGPRNQSDIAGADHDNTHWRSPAIC